MKKLTILFLFFISAYTAFSQAFSYGKNNSIDRTAIVIYEKDARGFYHKKENVKQDKVDAYTGWYAYDKKNHELYVKGYYANYKVIVKDNYSKFLKKSTSVPKLKGDELRIAIEKVNSELDEKFMRLNQQRQKQIEDSIAKAKEDSIAKIREDSIRRVRRAEERENYRKNHEWQWVPINGSRLSCTLCNEYKSSKDSLMCLGIKNDTIYDMEMKDLMLGERYFIIHSYIIPNSLKNYKNFKLHLDIFGDSLQIQKENFADLVNYYNEIEKMAAYERVEKKAPYGFFEHWGWDREYGFISFSFRYTNTNKNTIKYIDVYWRVTNDVNDVRKTGHFKGTGPLGFWETASWDWDSSMYYVAGDASHMDITKVIITYMNGKQKVLPKNMLWFN